MKTRAVTVDGLRAFLTEPDAPTTAGVLVLPAVVGIDDHMERVCGWLNAAGLTALVWDPFAALDADVPPEERWPIGRDQLDDRPAREEQQRWAAYMREQLGLAKVGVLGFCLGGRMALTLCAAEPRLQACVAYHPSIEQVHPPRHLDAVAAARDIRCPVQVLYPGRDHVTHVDTFRALRDALESRRHPTIIHVYPEADHGFTEGFSIVSKTDRSANPANVMAKVLAWPQTIAFLKSCLA